MNNTATLRPSKGLAITYLVRLSIASPSGGRSEIENLNVIKKIREGFFDYPYASSQAMKRALRDTLKGLGYSVSPIISSSPARTAGDPIKYVDDDLFGYMEAGSKKTGNSEVDKLNGIRKAVVSMTPLLSLREFQDNVDFGANMMGLQTGSNPMPYETEVHRGWYRISLYIELDRIGTGDGFIADIKSVDEKENLDELLKSEEEYDFVQVNGSKYFLMKKIFSRRDNTIAYNRAKALLDSIRFLAPSGRSSNWLIDLTPKLMVAAYVKGARTPFLETPLLDEKQKDKNVINLATIQTVKETFADGIESNGDNVCLVVGYREDLIQLPTDSLKPIDKATAETKDLANKINVQTMKIAFETIDGWLKQHFNIQDQKTSSTSQT
ncbi:type I-B CRISPR-associated protein Cas7/Cst2/DevR [Candidatus Methanoperedens nitratireducens]|uniref:Putative CRISPR-associated autoregulator, DevR family n=1 Tax=Candidatus Methanoperedens nitratireducens TaxID=1392998 RepID=A0A284VN94_9EURY|nr:type I-B CRISPR-associated protein Cas7/Cst2/DevR [Candidatus Methanoperedens nitroreducens]SNQ60761.1 putative CRISPR-associated autoregulator, DevR family [Candidatus Methanoperedens nitroreducens]